MGYPVLISGYRSPVNPVSVLTPYNFQLIAGRGDAWAMDIMAVSDATPFVGGNIMSINAGGKVIITNAMVAAFQRTAWPRCYDFIRGKYQETQNINVIANNVDALAIEYGYFVHFYHDNPLMEDPEWQDRIKVAQLGFKYIDYYLAAGVSTKDVTRQFDLNTKAGNIVAVQLLADTPGAELADITVLAGGKQIFINTCLGLGMPDCSRPAMLFPIDIAPGERIEFSIDNDNPAGSVAMRGGVRFWFDGLH